MTDPSKDILKALAKKELGVNYNPKGEESENAVPDDSKKEDIKKRQYNESYQRYEDHPKFKVSNRRPKGFMPPDEDLAYEQFQKIFDDDYKDKVDLYKRIHTVKEAFLDVFNNCVDIYFRQVKHKYGTSGVIFVPQKYIGNKCTIILWPQEGDDPKIKNVKETMVEVKRAEEKLKNEDKERDNS